MAAFGSYAIRIAHGQDKTKWDIRIKKTARAAASEARYLAGTRKGDPIVCVFDLSKWGRSPVCFQADGEKTRYPRKKNERGLGLRKLVRRVAFRPATYKYAPAKGRAV